MSHHFPVIIEQDTDGVYIAECPSLVGCRSYGYSIEEVMRNIKEAIEACSEEDPPAASELVFVGIRDLELIGQ